MGEVIERCLNHMEQNRLKRIEQRHELKMEQRRAWKLPGDRGYLLTRTEPYSSANSRWVNGRLFVNASGLSWRREDRRLPKSAIQ